MNSINIDRLDAVLKHKNICGPWRDAVGDERFERVRLFRIGEQEFKIRWFVNISYLTCGGLMVPFHTVEQSGTWPNNKKLNLQFSYRGEVCAVLALEDCGA